jgi:hypothetical protein
VQKVAPTRGRALVLPDRPNAANRRRNALPRAARYRGRRDPARDQLEAPRPWLPLADSLEGIVEELIFCGAIFRLISSRCRAIGLVRACGHGRTAEAALPAHPLERAMGVASFPVRIMLTPTTIRRRPATRFLPAIASCARSARSIIMTS